MEDTEEKSVSVMKRLWATPAFREKMAKVHKEFRHTEEWKKILSERWKGNKVNIGRIQKNETIEKRAAKLRGKKYPGRLLSEEHKKKIGLSKTGKKRKPFSSEWKANIGKSHIGLSVGAKGSNWKGGITPLRKLIRDHFKTRQWRSDVFQRDDYTCQICLEKGGKLQADHYPKSFKQIFNDNNIKDLIQAVECEEFWNLNNGRTLCYECHRKTDTWGTH